jgi:6,7-dimethyl-8-ribityllumazine synthase
MSTINQNLSEKIIAGITNAGDFRFCVIQAEWNQTITDALAQGAIETLKANLVPDCNISHLIVPGSFELIAASKWAVDSGKFDAVISIGVIIKGDTVHFEYICQAVSHGLAHLNATSDIPVIFGVLTTLNKQQAEERAGGIHGNKGDEAAYTALKMVALKQKLMK